MQLTGVMRAAGFAAAAALLAQAEAHLVEAGEFAVRGDGSHGRVGVAVADTERVAVALAVMEPVLDGEGVAEAEGATVREGDDDGVKDGEGVGEGWMHRCVEL